MTSPSSDQHWYYSSRMCALELGQCAQGHQHGVEGVVAFDLQQILTPSAVKVPKPSNSEEDHGEATKDEPQLPVTLVRIPAQTKETSGASGQNGGLEP
jgi:hypothetical protein